MLKHKNSNYCYDFLPRENTYMSSYMNNVSNNYVNSYQCKNCVYFSSKSCTNKTTNYRKNSDFIS